MIRRRASSAWTAKYGPVVFTGMAVSKPVRCLAATLISDVGVGPAHTVHEETWVAPFQLAYTVAPPPDLNRAAAAGRSSGWPAQSFENPRYDEAPPTSWPSSSRLPLA